MDSYQSVICPVHEIEGTPAYCWMCLAESIGWSMTPIAKIMKGGMHKDVGSVSGVAYAAPSASS